MNKNIKLLTIIESLGKGGAERVLVNTVPELKKIGIDCEIIILFNKDDLAQELEEFGIKVHRLELSNKWNIFEAIIKLNRIYRNKNYDIVHAHLFFAHFHTALSLLFNKKIKKVVTFHNLGFDEYPANSLIKKTRKKIEELCVKTFDLKTAVSNAVKEHYSFHLNLKNVKIINNSFPIATFEKYKTKKEKFNSFTILTPGRFVPKKGHKYLIEAINILNKRKLNLNFLFIGDGPLKNSIKVETEKISNIDILDALPHNELMKLYRNVDLIVIPSIYEAFGLVVGEAMIMEIPIIATKVDGIVEMIENRKEGLLVEPANPQELADAIEEMYLNKVLRENLIINAKEKIKEFDTENIAKKWKKYYEDILK